MSPVEIAWELKKLKESVVALQGMVQQISEKFIPGNELWDNAELCRYWKISPRTAATLRATGGLGHIFIGGKVYYSRENRDEYLNQNTVSHEN